jgi:parvulin-like peptidyl-prolyl isomerase
MARRGGRPTTSTRGVEPARKVRSRRQREMSQLRRLWVVLVVVGVLIVGVLGYGAYQEYIATPNAPVAVVNGVPLRTSAYERRVSYEQWQLAMQSAQLQQRQAELDPNDESQGFLIEYVNQQLQQIQAMIPQVPYQALQKMIDDELVRQEAVQREISIGDEELQRAIEEQFGYYRVPPTPFPTPVPFTDTLPLATPAPTSIPMTLEQFQKGYDAFVEGMNKQTKMSEAELRQLMSNELLRGKLRDALASEVPVDSDQVLARHILVETEEEAQQVLERLESGESFEALAAELSTDETNKDEGGELGWFPEGQMVPEFERAAFDAEIGSIVGPVETSFGWHIIQVEGHEVRQLEPSMLEFRRGQALEDWLSEARSGEGVENLWETDMAPAAPQP